MKRPYRILFLVIASFISYFVVRIWFPEEDIDNPNDDLRTLSKEDPLDPKTYTRGGNLGGSGGIMNTLEEIFRYVSKDRALKISILLLFGGTGLTEFTSMIRKQLINASPILLSLLGFDRSLRLQKLVKTLPAAADGIRPVLKQLYTIVNDPSLTNEEKVYLLKKLIKAAFVSLSGANKRVFLIFPGYLLIFLLTNNTPVFAALVAQLRQVIKSVRTYDGILDFIIETYKEYNAPFPEELIKQIKK